MSFPTGVVCVRCGKVLATMIKPVPAPLNLEFACADCVSAAAEAKRVTLDSAENWQTVIAELRNK
jgi:hypothetical protein